MCGSFLFAVSYRSLSCVHLGRPLLPFSRLRAHCPGTARCWLGQESAGRWVQSDIPFFSIRSLILYFVSCRWSNPLLFGRREKLDRVTSSRNTISHLGVNTHLTTSGLRLQIGPATKMGQNLSLSEKFASTSKATLAPWDREADIILGVIWACCLYGIGAIWCTVGLLRRWSGHHEEREINIISLLAAFLLSSGWPVILVYFAMSNRA